MHHEPFLIDTLPGQGGDGFFLGLNRLRQRLQLGDIIVDPQRGHSRHRQQRQQHRQPDRQRFMALPGRQPAQH
ncbi:hypothetical protein D3C75_1197320 [compost metagenome]